MKNLGQYCGLFEGRNHLIILLLPKSELIQPKNAHKQSNFRGFFITIDIIGSQKDISSHGNPLSLTVETFYRRLASTKL